MTRKTQPAAQPAIVLADRLYPGDWRVEWIDDHGGKEVAIFAGPNARERALRYADRQYGLLRKRASILNGIRLASREIPEPPPLREAIPVPQLQQSR